MGASALNLFIWWKAIGLMGSAAEAGGKPTLGAIFTVLALLIKLPLYVACWMLAKRLGAPAPTCFLWGIGLVYLALFGWVLAKR